MTTPKDNELKSETGTISGTSEPVEPSVTSKDNLREEIERKLVD